MTTARDVGCIVVGAGRSRRMGGERAKIWLELGGQPLLAHALRTLESYEELAQLVLVVRDEDRGEAESLARRVAPGLSARLRVVAGGAERRDSVSRGLAALDDPSAGVVLVHDAARPLATVDLFRRVARAARHAGAAVPAIAVADTLKRVGGAGRLATIERDGLHAVQTPQGFERRLLERAHGAPGPAGATDDAMLVEALGERVMLVEGEPANLKVTRPVDLELAARLLAPAAPPVARVGLGHDLHRLERGGPLRLGGVDVEGEVHATGHSDADALLHALTDAILGALALGDLGQHFPDAAEENRGRDSAAFLHRALELARASGYGVAQVDAVVRLERPRLAPHRARIVARVAGLLGLPDSAVSVKAKTGEGLDAVGEGRAVACEVIAQLVRRG